MTIEELNKLVDGGEGDRVEFKESTGQRAEACRTLCAFLNGDGGTVVFTRPTKQEWNAKVHGSDQAVTGDEGTSLKTSLKTGLKDDSVVIVQTLRQMIMENPAITIPMMSEATKLSRNGVLYHLQSLKDEFGLTRVGGRKSGHWEFQK